MACWGSKAWFKFTLGYRCWRNVSLSITSLYCLHLGFWSVLLPPKEPLRWFTSQFPGGDLYTLACFRERKIWTQKRSEQLNLFEPTSSPKATARLSCPTKSCEKTRYSTVQRGRVFSFSDLELPKFIHQKKTPHSLSSCWKLSKEARMLFAKSVSFGSTLDLFQPSGPHQKPSSKVERFSWTSEVGCLGQKIMEHGATGYHRCHQFQQQIEGSPSSLWQSHAYSIHMCQFSSDTL